MTFRFVLTGALAIGSAVAGLLGEPAGVHLIPALKRGASASW